MSNRMKIIRNAGTGDVFVKGRLLGDGTTAEVYEVVQQASKKNFACKIVPKKYEHVAHNEISVLQKLKHKNIVALHSNFEDSDNVYLIMEICVHKTLIELIEERGGISELEARYYLRQILQGCQHIHNEGLIHRDLKLNNVFLNTDLHIKIGDFGSSVEGTEEIGGMVGTPNYLAPEILADNFHTQKVDVWAIGVCLYFLLAGVAPFETESLEETYEKIRNVHYNMPDEFSTTAKELIKRLLVFDPVQRPTIDEILAMPFFDEGPQFEALPEVCLKQAPEVCEIGKILNSRVDAEGKTQYLIKWKGYGNSHNSWELDVNCDCPDLIVEFNKSAARKKQTKGKAPQGRNIGTKKTQKSKTTRIAAATKNSIIPIARPKKRAPKKS